MHDDSNITKKWVIAISAIAIIAMIAMLLLPPFRLFDTRVPTISYLYLLIELFTVIISVLVLVMSYHSLATPTGQASANVLTFGFAVVAVCDLAHALTYPGMPGFVVDGGVERTIFFRLMGRSFEIAALIAIANYVALPGARLIWLLAAGMACAVIGWFGIVHINWFPATVLRSSPTSFKSAYEYVLAALNGGTALVLWIQASKSNSARRYLLSGACVVMAAGGIVLTQYRTPMDFTFTFGLLFKVVAYALVYRAAFVFAIKEPHRLLQQSEQQQRDSQQQLKALSDNLPNGMVYQSVTELDGSRRFQYVSAGIERMTLNALSAQDLLQDSSKLYSTIVAEDLPLLEMASNRSAANLSVLNIIIRVHRVDGAIRYIRLSSQPRRMDDGRILWDGIVVDVTERERIDMELRRLNAELENRVAERTAALTHANKSLESFSYMVAHDLRVPLRHIAGYTAVLKHEHADKLGEDGRRVVDKIADYREAMSRLIDAILAMSRLEHTQMERSNVNLSELVSSIARELVQTEPHRQVEFTIQPNLSADVDRTLMKNVLHNLLGNAWKFTVDRAPAHIEFGANDVNGKRIYFVRDNGVGFEPADADKLFDLFRRLSTHDDVAGHGIGLASVKSIIANHGGTVWAEGIPGGGATIYFDLPLTEASTQSTIETTAV